MTKSDFLKTLRVGLETVGLEADLVDDNTLEVYVDEDIFTVIVEAPDELA